MSSWTQVGIFSISPNTKPPHKEAVPSTESGRNALSPSFLLFNELSVSERGGIAWHWTERAAAADAWRVSTCGEAVGSAVQVYKLGCEFKRIEGRLWVWELSKRNLRTKNFLGKISLSSTQVPSLFALVPFRALPCPLSLSLFLSAFVSPEPCFIK